ncbi:hypothetical protein [Paraburkholderia atlantica]|uniref:Lipoprotein n=1 Tax=Paraburkholderia atlantica TaxID=2654982 RepID=D5W7J6_PARAM|nr:hypothetical protein [Paraburkholderia atlantica]ADG15391.1 conserved hypothetical protein [Paraburkholderia atlantica]MBB5504106.1 hypothetical protein [Paraburkholderia atlantica]
MQFTTQPRRAGRFHRLRSSAAFALVRRASLSASLPAALLLAAGLGGCASSNTTTLINLPNGQTGFAVNCSGADAGSSWASCYVQAGKACGATGYDIVSKDNDEGGTAGGSVTNVASANVKGRSMIVRCK